MFGYKDSSLTDKAVGNLQNLEHPPTQILVVPPPGIYPEINAWEWAIGQITNEYVMHLDADVMLDPLSASRMMYGFDNEDVAMVAAMVRDPIVKVAGHQKMWRVSALKQVIAKIKNNFDKSMPDTSLLNGIYACGLKIKYIPHIVATHHIPMEPYTIFAAYLRGGIKQRLRGLLGTDAATWGLDGAMEVNTGWSQIAMLGFHTGIQLDYHDDVHDPNIWDKFARTQYDKVKTFCENLAVREQSKPKPTRRLKVMFAHASFLLGGSEKVALKFATNLDQTKYEPIIAFEHGHSSILTDIATAKDVRWKQVMDGQGNRQERENAWIGYLTEEAPDIIISCSFVRSCVHDPAAVLGIPMIERGNGHSGIAKVYFDKIICEHAKFAEELKSELAARHIPTNKVMVQYNGVDTAEFKHKDKKVARQKTNIRENAIIIGTVSRVHPIKNISLQIRGLKLLVQDGVDAELHILGQCVRDIELNEKKRLIALATTLEITDRLKFHDASPNVSDYLAAFDIATLTSFSEGAPNAVIEAMVQGRPLVCTDVGGIREIVGDQAKYVSGPSDDVGFAQHVKSLLGIEKIEYINASRHDIKNQIIEISEIIDDIYIKYHETLPYEKSGDKINVGILCYDLNIGGVEVTLNELERNIDRRRFNVTMYAVSGGPLAESIKSKIKYISGPREITYPKVRRLLIEDKIDVAIAYSFPDLFKSVKPCKVIERRDGDWIYIMPPGAADLVVSESKTMHENLLATGKYDKAKCTYINVGRNPETFARNQNVRKAYRKLIGADDDTLVIANIGRMDAYKNQMNFVLLSQSLTQRKVKHKIVIMGPDHGKKAEIESEIQVRGLSDSIILMDGSLDGPAQLLSGADLYIHLSSREGMSGAIIEACHAGLPIIATNVGGTHDIVTNNGVLVKPEDLHIACEHIIIFFVDKNIQKRCSEQSLKNAAEFTTQKMVKRYEEEIERLATDYRNEQRAQPKVTFIMPVRDRHEFLEKAIESVLKQRSKNWNLIITLDGEQPPAVMNIINKFKDSRITVISGPRLNQCTAINRAVCAARTPYVSRIDSDDMLEERAVETITRYAKNNPDIGYFYSACTFVDENDKPISIGGMPPLKAAEPFSPAKMEQWFIGNHLITWKRSDFVIAGGLPEDIDYGEDYLFALTAMLYGVKFMAINESLYFFREHHAQRLSTRDRSTRVLMTNLIRERYSDLKAKLGVSWQGEDPTHMQPRRWVGGKHMERILSNTEIFDMMYAIPVSDIQGRRELFVTALRTVEYLTEDMVIELACLVNDVTGDTKTRDATALQELETTRNEHSAYLEDRLKLVIDVISRIQVRLAK